VLPFNGLRRRGDCVLAETEAGVWLGGQFECGTCILHVIHGRDARATFKLTTYPVFGYLEFHYCVAA
jgi:hypothetical protein